MRWTYKQIEAAFIEADRLPHGTCKQRATHVMTKLGLPAHCFPLDTGDTQPWLWENWKGMTLLAIEREHRAMARLKKTNPN